MRTKAAYLTACAFVLFLAAGAYAQNAKDKPVPARGLLQSADKNKDGKVTFEEAKAVRPKMTEERFKLLDADKDGVLTTGDFREDAGQFVGSAIKRADKDKDGKVTPDEFKAAFPKAPAERFTTLDHNKDGVLSKGDIVGKPRPPLGKLVEKADTNGDGKVTLEEMKAVSPDMTQELFSKLDKNKDGVLSKEDRPADTAEAGRRSLYPMLLKDVDANADGKTTYEEMKAKMPQVTEERFKKLDTNGDGVLTTEDIPRPVEQAGQAKPEQPPFRTKVMEADADKDGKVTFDEAKKAFPDLAQEKFKKFDTNGDGAISPEDKPANP